MGEISSDIERKYPIREEGGGSYTRMILVYAPPPPPSTADGPLDPPLLLIYARIIFLTLTLWIYLFTISGFLSTLLSPHIKCRKLEEVTLMRLKKNGAIGAAYLGAKAAGYILPLDYEDNVDVFFHQELWTPSLTLFHTNSFKLDTFLTKKIFWSFTSRFIFFPYWKFIF